MTLMHKIRQVVHLDVSTETAWDEFSSHAHIWLNAEGNKIMLTI